MYSAQVNSRFPAPTFGLFTHDMATEDSGFPAFRSTELLEALLDEVNHALVLVTENLTVRFANRTALRDCAEGEAVHCDGRRLQFYRAEDRRAIAEAVVGASRGRRAMLTLRAGSRSVSVGIVPMRESEDGSGAVALLMFGRAQGFDSLGLQFFAQMYALTPAERGVLQGLCEGLQASAVAARVGVALSTVRTQIGSIRYKTGAKSVSHLVQMVHALPPLVPAGQSGPKPVPRSLAPVRANRLELHGKTVGFQG